jgi:hypothetical protein
MGTVLYLELFYRTDGHFLAYQERLLSLINDRLLELFQVVVHLHYSEYIL